jgi:hypothetical protein
MLSEARSPFHERPRVGEAPSRTAPARMSDWEDFQAPSWEAFQAPSWEAFQAPSSGGAFKEDSDGGISDRSTDSTSSGSPVNW